MSSFDLHGVNNHDGQMVSKLLSLPHKILHHHEVGDVQQLVLHELGHEQHFGLNKAGYFIDNPDFDCLKGVAGYSKDECALHKKDLWEDPSLFAQDMQQAPFHNQVATFKGNSLARSSSQEKDHNAFHDLGMRVGMKNPSMLTWRMKHGNHGILLFDCDDAGNACKCNLLHHFVALLSLC